MYNLLFSKFVVGKFNSLQVVKTPKPKTPFLVNLRSFFSTLFFRWAGVVFSCYYKCRENFVSTKRTLQAGLKKTLFNFLQKPRFLAVFGYLGHPSKSIFRKSSVIFRRGCQEEYVKSWALFLFGLRRGEGEVGVYSPFASRHLSKSVNLASCNFVWRPFSAR